MAGVLGRAFIQVFADLSKFTPGLRQEIKKALDEQTKGLKFDELDKSARKAGEEAADELAKGVDSKIENDMKKEGKKGGFSLGKGLMAAWSGVVAGFLPTIIALGVEIVAGLAPAVAALGAALPAAIGGAVAAMAVLKIATSGVGAAIKDAFDPKKVKQFNEEMKKLAPAARSFVLEIRRLQPLLHQIKQDVQQSFFAQLKGDMTNIGKYVLPVLHNGLRVVAADFGRLAHGVLDVVASSGRDIAKIFTVIHNALATVGPAMGDFVQIFVILARDAGPIVQLLSKGFADLLDNFTLFLAAESRSGGLAQFFQGAVDILHQFGGLLSNVWGLIMDILGALQQTGSQGLGALSRIVGMLEEFFRSAEGHDTLVALFNLLNVVLDSLFRILTPLLPALGKMATILANGIAGALIKVTPYLVELTKWLDKHQEVLWVAIGAWAAYKTAVLAAAAAEALADALNPIGAIILGIALYVAWVIILIKHWRLIEHYALVVLDALGRFFVGIWNWIKGVGSDIANWFTVTVPNFFASLPGKIWAALSALPGILGQLFLDALHAAGEAIGIGVGLILAYFIKLPGLIWWEIKGIGHLFVDLWNLAFSLGKAALDAQVAVVLYIFTQLPGKIANFVNRLPGIIGGAFRAAWDWAKREVVAGANAVVDFAAKLPGRIGHFFDNIGHTILGGLKAGINSVISGFNSGIDKVAGFIHIGLPHIPLLASGGVVKAPTLAVVGEAGPEAVIPLSDPAKAATAAQRAGLLDILGSRMNNLGNVMVQVYLGTTQITDILDKRVQAALDDQAQQLAFGTR